MVVVGDGMEDYRDLLVIERAKAKCLLRTHENVLVKGILYSDRRMVGAKPLGVDSRRVVGTENFA